MFLKLYFIIEKKNLTIASMGIGFRDSENGRRESKKSLFAMAYSIALKGVDVDD